MIRRDQIEPGAWFVVPVIASAAGPLRADLAYLRVDESDGFRVRYTEHRRGLDRRYQAQRFGCSPETFQRIFERDGCAVAAEQVPAEIR